MRMIHHLRNRFTILTVEMPIRDAILARTRPLKSIVQRRFHHTQITSFFFLQSEAWRIRCFWLICCFIICAAFFRG